MVPEDAGKLRVAVRFLYGKYLGSVFLKLTDFFNIVDALYVAQLINNI